MSSISFSEFFLLSPLRGWTEFSLMCKEGTSQRKAWRASMRVCFDQKNRRRQGSKSHARYEKYKVASTVNHAWHLGASLRDLDTDLARGFVEILDDGTLPEVVPIGHEAALPIENGPESESLEGINPFRREAILPPELACIPPELAHIPDCPMLSELPKTRDVAVQTLPRLPVEQELSNLTHETYALRQTILEYKFGPARIRQLSARAEHEMMCS